jgi:hypothetical protein
MLRRLKTAQPQQSLKSRIRKVLKVHARLHRDADRLSEHADLYEAGMSPHASAHVMLALEHEFDLEFPEQILSPSVFGSIGTIASTLTQLGAAG